MDSRLEEAGQDEAWQEEARQEAVQVEAAGGQAGGRAGGGGRRPGRRLGRTPAGGMDLITSGQYRWQAAMSKYTATTLKTISIRNCSNYANFTITALLGCCLGDRAPIMAQQFPETGQAGHQMQSHIIVILVFKK